jgi:nucleotide-binding universal stress UspA family protein
VSGPAPGVAGAGEGRVVVGVDGSACGTRALHYAARLAADLGAVLHIVCVYHILPTDLTVSFPLGLTEQDALTVLRESLADVSRDTPDVVTKCEHLFGAPGPVLVEVSEGATSLVVGTRGHGYVVGVLLGSVSEYVVHHASCTTTVVR